MAKPGKKNPLLISIAEKVGTTMGRIVATTSDAMEATRSFLPGEEPPKPKKAAPAQTKTKKKSVTRRKGTAAKKKPVRRPPATARKRKPKAGK